MTTWQTQEEWDQIAAARKARAEELQARLDAYLDGRPGWGCWEGTWSSTVYSAPGEVHTTRRLTVIAYKGKIEGGKGVWAAGAHDRAEFEDPVEAVAWAEQPRSEHSIQHRREMAALEAYARRNDVDLDGLKGKKVDTGLSGGAKREHYDVIEFDGVHRVRVTHLADDAGYRVTYNRRRRIVPTKGLDPAARAKAIADVVREMTGLTS